jgi:hypothetical protein
MPNTPRPEPTETELKLWVKTAEAVARRAGSLIREKLDTRGSFGLTVQDKTGG